MHTSIKTLIISVASAHLMLSFWFADNTDCERFAPSLYYQSWAKNWFNEVKNSRWTTTNKYSNFLSIPEQIDIDNEIGIIDSESLDTAILNLKKYCCENSIWSISPDHSYCKTDHSFFNSNSLDSPYLFDHLFDVIMRRLNGLSWDTNIYNNMKLDNKWSERRSKISSYAENLSWVSPQIIVTEYQKMRSANNEYDISSYVNNKFISDSTSNFLLFVSWQWDSDDSKKVKDALINYKNWSLYDRYRNACALTEYFYALLLGGDTDSTVKNETIKNITKWVCDDIVSNQIKSENIYTKLIMKKSANLFQKNYFEWYTSYMHNRMESLQSTWRNSVDRFFDVVRAVPQLIKNCTF